MLRPQSAARTTAHQRQALHCAARRVECGQTITQAKGHALHDGIGQAGCIGVETQAMETSTHIGIVVGRALAAQVRQKQRRCGALRHAQRTRLFCQCALAGRTQQAGHPLQGAGRRQHHAHLVPAARQGVAKRMRGAGRIGLVTGRDHKQHAAGAQRQKALARLRRAHAHGAGRVVARATGHHNAAWQAQRLRDVGFELAPGFAAFHQAGHMGLRQMRQCQQGIGPGALLHIQPQRAAGIRHIGHVVAREHQAHIVFGQQNFGYTRKQFGFVFGHPAQFGRCEAGHGQATSQSGQAGQFVHPFDALHRRAGVVPQNGGAQYLVLGVQQHGSVHLA